MLNKISSKARILLAVIAAALALCLLIGMIILARDGGKSTDNAEDISIQPYTEEAVDGMEMTGTYCKTVLSTKKNRELSKRGYIVLENAREYETYLDDYLDIIQTMPEQVPIMDDWYAAGYQAVVFSTDEFGTDVTLTASGQYVGDNSLKIVITPTAINPAYKFSKDISNCKQTSVIVYIKTEILDGVDDIEFLVDGEV